MDYLPDYLPGNPPMYGVKQQTAGIAQGSDAYLPIDYSNSPVADLEGYDIRAMIKQTLDTNDVVWFGDFTNGLVTVDDVDYLHLNVDFMMTLPAGYYYVTVYATRDDASSPSQPAHFVIQEFPISIRDTAASNNLGSMPPVAGASLQ